VHNQETYFVTTVPFDRLRANGLNPFVATFIPFVVSLSNHQSITKLVI
jgi:hypothetical protein